MDHEVALIQFRDRILQELQKRIASGQSSYPDTPNTGQLSRAVRDGRQALRLIFISTFLDYWNTDVVIRAIGQKAYQNNYQGIWQEVQDFLEHYQNDPMWFVSEYLKIHGPFDFFGNFLNRVKREIRMIRIKPDHPPSYSLPRVRRKVWRRGYDDKGHRRPPHEDHGDPPVPSSEKNDRRPWIHHPLLEDFAAQDNGTGTTSQKGEDYHERSS